MSERMFPILQPDEGSPSQIPWRMLDEGWAQKNHGQSLQRLAQRGGLSACEAMANIERRAWRKMEQPGSALAAFVKADEIGPLREAIALLLNHYSALGVETDDGPVLKAVCDRARAALNR